MESKLPAFTSAIILSAVLGRAMFAGAQQAAATPLPLPDDPNTACSRSVFVEFTRIYSFCPFENWPQHNPDALCCKGIVDYFGMNSTKPSRNCFCVPEVWQRLTAQFEYHSIPFETVFRYCSHTGYVVPFYQEGRGYCNGTQDDPYAPADYDVFYVEKLPTASFSNWVLRLDMNWLVLLGFMASIASVPGFLLFLWPFAFESVLTARTTAKAIASGMDRLRVRQAKL